MILIEELKKSYNNLEVLKNINMHIKKGTIFGIAGRSGTGKSTLLRCINGLEKYNGGSLKVGGTEVNSLSEEQLRLFRKDIGMIFQNFSLLNRVSVYENIALPMKCWHYDKKIIDNKVKELLEIIGIPEKIHSKARELSGGQKQRVAIARALTLEPKILLCDEATSALDPKSTQAILTLLLEINKKLGITVVVVTHEMSVLRNVCEEIAIIEDGSVNAIGTVENIFMNRPEALINLLGDNEIATPKTGKAIEILFSRKNSNNPIITRLARELNIDFSIIGGDMESFKGNSVSSIIINISEKDTKKVIDFLEKNHVLWREIVGIPLKEEI
ncbi:methionine ABC transporter ATP-binding protein [Brassicibacter mesophilus]|uniref:methionine ABC transporter ATP-binding protein n=1 Tax=Brassicibacter mesophilus TaxID=745119 RepID=UPI003D21A3E5